MLGTEKVKTGYLVKRYSGGTVGFTATPTSVGYSAPLCPSALLSSTYSSSPEVGNGLSWPKPPSTCNAMVTNTSQA